MQRRCARVAAAALCVVCGVELMRAVLPRERAAPPAAHEVGSGAQWRRRVSGWFGSAAPAPTGPPPPPPGRPRLELPARSPADTWLVFQVVGPEAGAELAASARRLLDNGFSLAWAHCRGSAATWFRDHPDIMGRLVWVESNATGTKFDIWASSLPGLLRLGPWERVWLLDDDVSAAATDLGALRRAAAAVGVPLVQPAVQPARRKGRGTDHPHLRPQRGAPAGSYLFTNLVEVMAPAFTPEALAVVLGAPLYARRASDCFWCGVIADALPAAGRCPCAVLTAPETAVTHHDRRSARWRPWQEDWGILMDAAAAELRAHNVCPAAHRGAWLPLRTRAWAPPCSA
eukprot:TRINITY_DN31849_c0_g1_i1.p1 TRINITY_DN31849_c0_g1~~TRINITY_DN31849_c0_g1_i1.p1  ORF type:complete len:365 (+),score=96.75 TRINITY_DN31849_c0_g1_i1:66-1097(+)